MKGHAGMGGIKLTTFRCGTGRTPGEGLRIGTVRYLPRGVKKENYAKENFFDVWLPIVAPSRELLTEFKKHDINDPKTLETFFGRYEHEMKNSTDARQTIHLLAAVAAETPIAIGCYCEDESQCHRIVLKRIIHEVSKGQWA